MTNRIYVITKEGVPLKVCTTCGWIGKEVGMKAGTVRNFFIGGKTKIEIKDYVIYKMNIER